MSGNFFANYKKFIVEPEDVNQTKKEVYDPKNYAAHYILTLSIFNSRLTTWRDAGKYEIDVDKSIKTVLADFNKKHFGIYHLQLLELDKFKNYFILALSVKAKIEPMGVNAEISLIIDKLLTNPFYVGQNWFNLIGEKGRVERKLFCCSYMEYTVMAAESSVIQGDYESVSEKPLKPGAMKLVKSSPIRDIL